MARPSGRRTNVYSYEDFGENAWAVFGKVNVVPISDQDQAQFFRRSDFVPFHRHSVSRWFSNSDLNFVSGWLSHLGFHSSLSPFKGGNNGQNGQEGDYEDVIVTSDIPPPSLVCFYFHCLGLNTIQSVFNS